MQDYEKLGKFYLGRPFDLDAGKPGEGLILYDSSDLVTHAVCVGMTGSGKTGLCLGILEEAAIDGIPAIVIDPKGDLANLLLTFPELDPDQFRPWINEEDARAKGVTPDQYAADQAALWKKGLAEWGQDGGRIRRLKEAAEFALYTPGSSAGLPVSVLKSLSAPPPAVIEDGEALTEQITATVTGLLGLLGVDADPLRSREHILLSTILRAAWKEGRDLDLATLIGQIQSPPVARIGVLELDAFFPEKDRFALAMTLNNLLASPGFEAWLEGEPLDIDRMLHGADGRPRVSIFSIAHLGDAERMFFVSFLLNRMIGWMRSQSGTTSLRALLYMDEIFGYFPPVANPPSKAPLLTLLKQARAFGLGCVLATQNPVDLDYKGLANAGTWFLGRLQTERDKLRVLDGLQGAAAGAGSEFDRGAMERIVSGLGSRVFLMHNVHDDSPEIFQTRWTLSYLRGPLTRAQIKALKEKTAADAAKRGEPSGAGAAEATGGGEPNGLGATEARAGGKDARGGPAEGSGARTAEHVPVITGATGVGKSAVRSGVASGSADKAGAGRGLVAGVSAEAVPRPLLPPAIPQYFAPIQRGRPAGVSLVYVPMLFGSAQVRFVDRKAGVDTTQDAGWLTPITEAPVPVNWDEAREAGFSDADLAREAGEEGTFGALAGKASKPASYDGWSREFAAWLARTQKATFLRSPSTGELSRPGEDERAFRIRLQQLGRERRDEQKDRLQARYAPKTASLTERLRRAEQAVAREAEQANAQKMQAAISIGATLLGSLFGRRAVSTGTIGRATTAARGVGRAMKESGDIGRARESVEAIRAQLAELEAEFQAELQSLETKTDPLTESLEPVALSPLRKDIAVRLVALAWAPHWRDASGSLAPAW